MKKKADVYCDLDFWIYPFSLRKVLSTSSSSIVVGMILQLITFGAPSFRLIAWSHGLDGGN